MLRNMEGVYKMTRVLMKGAPNDEYSTKDGSKEHGGTAPTRKPKCVKWLKGERRCVDHKKENGQKGAPWLKASSGPHPTPPHGG